MDEDSFYGVIRDYEIIVGYDFRIYLIVGCY